MRLANCLVGGALHLCSVTEQGVVDLTLSAANVGQGGIPHDLDEALRDWPRSMLMLSELERRTLDRTDAARFLADRLTAKFRAPITSPSKILCVFVNYRSHGHEIGVAPSEPVYFFKHSDCIVGDGDDVLIPKFSTKMDHEVELALVMGKRGKDIRPEEAYDHVAGYTVLNDISYRDGMRRGVEGTVLGRNLFKGKVADTALPLGPWLVTRDEIPDPYPLKIILRVNGEVRQDGSTDDMIFRVPELVASASEDNTLLPGDIIATGTCSGVGLYSGKYLNDGDVMEAEVERVGTLRNTVRKQRS